MICFHGTRDPESVLKGIDLDVPRTHDSGDFGWGFYCTFRQSRAACYGHVLRVDVDLSEFAHIDSPYFLRGFKQLLPETPEEELLYSLLFADGPDVMLTIKGSRADRDRVSRQIRTEFLQRGWKGIVSASLAELVVFDTSAVRDVRREGYFRRAATEPLPMRRRRRRRS